MSRCDWEWWLSPKRLIIRFHFMKNPLWRCHSGLYFFDRYGLAAKTAGYTLLPLSWLKNLQLVGWVEQTEVRV